MKKKEEKPKNAREGMTIYQANPLVQARKHYGIIEHRLFRLAIADLRPKLKNSRYYDEDFRPFHMTTKELLDKFQKEGVERHSLYERFFEAHKNMAGSYMEIGTAEKHRLVPVFEEISFDVKDGLLIQFNKKMRKLLLDLEDGGYTKSFLETSFALSSTYSLTLLELMLQFQGMQKEGIVERDLNMKELRFSMDVPEDAYDGRVDNFRRFVVDAAIREINDKTEYYIEPNYGLLRGQYNRVTGFHFVLHLPESRGQEQQKALPAPSNELAERLAKYGMDENTAKRLSQMPHAEECLQIALKNIQEAKHPIAYIKAAIEQDWHEQRETVRNALAEEKREQEDKKKWNLEASGRGHTGLIDENEIRTEEQRPSLEEIASSNSPYSEMAKKVLERKSRSSE